MRVTSSRLPVLDAREAEDRTTTAPTAERFRAALSVAGKADRRQAERTDDTMASAATQAAYLAGAAGLTSREPGDVAKPTRAADAIRTLGNCGAIGDVTGAAVATSGVGSDASIADIVAADISAEPAPRSDDAATMDLHTRLGGLIGGGFGAHGASRNPLGRPQVPDGDPARAVTLRALYGIATDATAGAAQPQTVDATCADSPVAAWRAAAVGRALGSFGGATGATVAAANDGNANAEAVQDVAATSPVAGAVVDPSQALTALTPLEQAVRDLVDQLAEREPDRADENTIDEGSASELVPLPGPGTAQPTAPRNTGAAPASGPAHAAFTPPEPAANPSHVHLVIEDGPERVVATVALRGSEVLVALRATDDATAAALARNAGALDHAMRSRGLDLGELTAEREPRDRRPSQDAEPRERRPRNTERFALEENS